MSQNIEQIYLANPITSNATTDLMYFGQSPYGAGNDAAMTYSNFKAQFPPLNGVVLLTPSADQTITAHNLIVGNGNLQAGKSGQAGTLISYPLTATTGSLILAAVANTGNTNTTISNAAMGQASTISIPDPGGATANFTLAPSALVSGNLVKASGTAGLLVDAGIPAVNIVTWSSLAGTTQTAVVNTGYIPTNAGQTTITLPVTAPAGSIVTIQGYGAAGWVLAAGTGQTIQYGQQATSSGGSLTSAHQYDSVEVVCIVANTTWGVRFSLSTGLTVA